MATAKTTTKPRTARRLRGEVLRRSGDKTVAVSVTRVAVHPVYQKRSVVAKTYLAHDPTNSATVGQMVTIRSVRPLSRRKRWLIVSENNGHVG